MSAPGGDADEEVTLRIKLQNEVSRSAAAAKVSIDEVADSAERAGLRMDEETLAARRLKRAMEELAAANEEEARSENKTAKQKLTASRAVRSAEKEAQAALKEVDRLRKIREENQKRQTKQVDKETQSLKRWSLGWKGVLGVLMKTDKFMTGMFGRLKKWDNIKKIFTGIFSIFKWTAIAGGVLYAAHALAALGTAGAVAMGGLVPLIGLYAGIPAIMATAAVGMGVFKAATANIGSTLQAFASYNWQAAYQGMARMAPAARALTLQLNALRVSTLRPLQQQLQQTFAGTLIRGNIAGNAKGFVGAMQGPLNGISQTLGKVVSNFGSFVNQPLFKSDFQTNLGTANTMIGNLGHAFTVIIGAINHAAAIMQPFFTWFGGALSNGADKLAAWVNSAKGASAITTFFQHTQTVAKGAWMVLKNLGSTLMSVMHAAAPLASMMGGNIMRASLLLKNYAGGPQGQAHLANFMHQVQLTLSQLFRIVVPLLGVLGTIFRAAQPFINTFGKGLDMFANWLNKFLKSSDGQRMLNTLFSTGSEILKTLVPVLETIVQVFADLLPYAADFIKVLMVGIRLFLPLIKGLAWFLGKIEPALKPIVATLAIMFAVNKIRQFMVMLDLLKTKWFSVGQAAAVAGEEEAVASRSGGMGGGMMSRIGGRLAGAGLIYMGGQMVGNAIGGDAGRITGDTATGAAIGFAIAGPLGAVAGGMIGALKGFTDDSNRLTQAMKDLSTAAQNWTDAFKNGQKPGSLGMKQSIAQLLTQQGMDWRAQKSGIDMRTLVNTIASGDPQKVSALINRWRKHGSPSDDTINILRSDAFKYYQSKVEGDYQRKLSSRKYLMGHGPAPASPGSYWDQWAAYQKAQQSGAPHGSLFNQQPGQAPKASSSGRGSGNSTDWWSNPISQLFGRWSGGLVTAQQPYIVGEKGAELFRNQFGEFLVGLNGPEVRTFDEPGTIIPNHSLAAERQKKLDAASPYRTPTIRSLAATTAPRVSKSVRRSGTREEAQGYTGPLVHVDQIVTRDAATTRRELERLIAQAEATKPEKIHWRRPRPADEES